MNSPTTLSEQVLTPLPYDHQHTIRACLYHHQPYVMSHDLLTIIYPHHQKHMRRLLQRYLPNMPNAKLQRIPNCYLGIAVSVAIALLNKMPSSTTTTALKNWLRLTFQLPLGQQPVSIKLVTPNNLHPVEFHHVPLKLVVVARQLYLDYDDLAKIIPLKLRSQVAHDPIARPCQLIITDASHLDTPMQAKGYPLIMGVNVMGLIKNLPPKQALPFNRYVTTNDLRHWLLTNITQLLAEPQTTPLAKVSGKDDASATPSRPVSAIQHTTEPNQQGTAPITTFYFHQMPLRTLVIDHEIYFVGKDVTDILGYNNSSFTFMTKVSDTDKRMAYCETSSGVQEMVVINQSGLIILVLGSHLATANKFKQWLMNYILPYLAQQMHQPAPAHLSSANKQQPPVAPPSSVPNDCQSVNDVQQSSSKLSQDAQDYYTKVLSNDDLMTTTQIAKDYGMSAKAFNMMLYRLHIQYPQGNVWLLYNKYAQHNYAKIFTLYRRKTGKQFSFTKWTQKGRKFLYDELKAQGIVPLIERPHQQ